VALSALIGSLSSILDIWQSKIKLLNIIMARVQSIPVPIRS
jgi:hypothetical protein